MCAFLWVSCESPSGKGQHDWSTVYSITNAQIFNVWSFYFSNFFYSAWKEDIVWFESTNSRVFSSHPKKMSNGVWLITFWDDATFASLCLFVSGRSWVEGQMARDLKISTSAVTQALVWQRMNITLWEEEEEEEPTVDCLLFKDKRHFEKRYLRWQKI